MGALADLTKPERLNCCLFVSSDAKSSRQQFQSNVPHSLITIARVATYFITAGQTCILVHKITRVTGE